MSFMIPTDNIHLGWPEEFPGKGELVKYGKPRNQFDIIANHAIFDNAGFRGYLKDPDPYFVVVVRDPITQAVSAKDYFHHKHVHWNDHLTWLESLDPTKDMRACTSDAGQRNVEIKCGTQVAHFLNPQANDLGWHVYAKEKGILNKKDGRDKPDDVAKWLKTLDDSLLPHRSIILAENFDEGLVLMRQALGCELEELSYLRMKVKKKHDSMPTAAQMKRLAQVNAVDVTLYDHLNKSFWKEWEQGDAKVLQSELSELKRMNADLVVACDEFHWDKKNCPQEFVTDEVKYSVLLKKRQRDWGLTKDGK